MDIATGTGDLAIEALSLNPEHITGVDISDKMLEMGLLDEGIGIGSLRDRIALFLNKVSGKAPGSGKPVLLV